MSTLLSDASSNASLLKHASGSPLPLSRRLMETRALSGELAGHLGPEDMVVQAMPDASPAKWHLAHVTWFFEIFVLKPHLPGYALFDERFPYCFNSYYESEGERHPRASRGLLTRPTCEEVLAYRAHVDAALERLFVDEPDPASPLATLVETGINHEQQHQELLLTDILALFAAQPLRPAFAAQKVARQERAPEPIRWLSFPGGIRSVGHDGEGFAWDNERPHHNVLLRPFKLADRLVTNAEWLAFIDDGGYSNPLLWLSDGWHTLKSRPQRAPLYWEHRDGEGWCEMTLNGLMPIEPAAPVHHVDYYEADAFARWAGARLPTEFEWESAALGCVTDGNTLRTRALRPLPASETGGGLRQVFGDVWEWTQSAYLPYPGYRPPEGALGEYNGKFMVGQHVLRGASCVTPAGHSRATYRNFFYPQQRWQFTGLRLAREAV